MKRKKLLIFLLVIFLLLISKSLLNKVYDNLNNKINSIDKNLVSVRSKIFNKNRLVLERFKYTKEIDTLINERDNLIKENNELISKNLTLEDAIKENKELREQLEIQKDHRDELKMASVILIDSFIHDDNIYINKGRKDNIKVGMPVLDKNYLIGTISYVAEDFSEVMLLTNKEFKLSVIVNDKTLAILRGNGNNTFSINRYHDEVSDIHSDYFDLKTSGISVRYPKGLNIGHYKVNSEEAYTDFQRLEFIPHYKLYNLTNVFIYIKNIDENLINQINEKENQK